MKNVQDTILNNTTFSFYQRWEISLQTNTLTSQEGICCTKFIGLWQ